MTEDILIQEMIALAPLTTLQVGGAARFFVEAQNESQVLSAFYWARKKGLPIFFLGGGSNLLISDAGFNGLVVRIALRGVEIAPDKNKTLFTAQAGENWDETVKFCVEQNYAGIECLSGIPGTTGATPIQNVGAYGQEVAQTIHNVRVFDCETFEIYDLTNAECKFAYRTSIFNTTAKNRFIVLSVTFNLKPNGKPTLSYADLQLFFAGKVAPTLSEVRDAVLKIRAAKSMVISERDENRRSAGSFFKNPIVDATQFAGVETAARNLKLIDDDQTAPHFSAGDGKIKIPAAWLIEKSGFHKGFVHGRV